MGGRPLFSTVFQSLSLWMDRWMDGWVDGDRDVQNRDSIACATS